MRRVAASKRHSFRVIGSLVLYREEEEKSFCRRLSLSSRDLPSCFFFFLHEKKTESSSSYFTPFISFCYSSFHGRVSPVYYSPTITCTTQQLLLRDDIIRGGMLSGWEISISFEKVYTTECVLLPFSFILSTAVAQTPPHFDCPGAIVILVVNGFT